MLTGRKKVKGNIAGEFRGSYFGKMKKLDRDRSEADPEPI